MHFGLEESIFWSIRTLAGSAYRKVSGPILLRLDHPSARLCGSASQNLVAWSYGHGFGLFRLLGTCFTGCRVTFVILHSGCIPVMLRGPEWTGHWGVIWLYGFSYGKPTGLFCTLGVSFVARSCCVYTIFVIYCRREIVSHCVNIAAPHGNMLDRVVAQFFIPRGVIKVRTEWILLCVQWLTIVPLPYLAVARALIPSSLGCLKEWINWLILPVVICLSQRLSHACPSTDLKTVKPRMAH